MTDASRVVVSKFVRSQRVEHSAAFMGKAFLEEHPSANGDLIHEAALVRCQLLHRLMMKGGKLLALLPHAAPALLPLSSYSVPQNDAQCPYTQFVWLSLLEDAGCSLPKAEEVLRALDDYRTEDGGYANVKAAKTATLNATAAALAVRGRLTGWQNDTDLEALQRLQDTMGGFRASALAPIPTCSPLRRLSSFFAPIMCVRSMTLRHSLRRTGWNKEGSLLLYWTMTAMWNMCSTDCWHYESEKRKVKSEEWLRQNRSLRRKGKVLAKARIS